jgi:hypothetical protein
MDARDGHGKFERVLASGDPLFLLRFRVDDGLVVKEKPPVIAAAVTGSAEQASGMCPSPATAARGGIEADPAAAGQVHFGPGVQIGEIPVRSARAVERFDVRVSWIK